MQSALDPNTLEVYSETRKRKVLVGTLKYLPETHIFEFQYERSYLKSKIAIPIGPELGLKKRIHLSTKDKLFPSFQERIPSRENPAYVEYCASQGIDPEERNTIILLGSIGRRGPSTFVFDKVYKDDFNVSTELKRVRTELKLSHADLGAAFDINHITLLRIEKGRSKDKNILKLITIYLSFPKVTLWQLRTTGKKLHQDKQELIVRYFERRKKNG